MPTKKKQECRILENWHVHIADNTPTPKDTQIRPITNTEQQQDFYNIPTSPATHTMLGIMGMGKEGLEHWRKTETAKQGKKNQDAEQKKTGLEALASTEEQPIKKEVLLKNGVVFDKVRDDHPQMRTLTINSRTATTTLQLSDIDKLTGTNKTAKKMFMYVLVKMNEQAYSDGILKRDFIQFPLQELVDIGLYKHITSARRGFKDAMEMLTSIKLMGTIEKGKKKTAEQSAIAVLFPYTEVKKGTCTVTLNNYINWDFIAAFYTILPSCYFGLSNRASDLLYYIFYLARQRVKEIKETGGFNISMQTIKKQLNLPNENETAKPRRDIVDVVVGETGVITEIEGAIGNENFTLTPSFDVSYSVADILGNGYIRIEFKKQYAERFIELADNKEKQIKAAQKRKEAIIDKAKAMNLAKKLKQEAE